MNCPHCGKETNINVVQRWREHFVQQVGHVYQLEEITLLPAPGVFRNYVHGHKQKGGPTWVIISEVVDETRGE